MVLCCLTKFNYFNKLFSMEIVSEVIENIVVLNEQLEFAKGEKETPSANFFVVCEDLETENMPKNIYEYDICGMSVIDWVKRACINPPAVLKLNSDDNILDIVKPYASKAEYSVVLYASTPLVRKQHIRDLLGYVSRKGLGVCKLKKGYVFKNDYIMGVDEIFSVDTYDFASDDFYEVKDFDDLTYAESVLKNKVLYFHKKNGAIFNSEATISIDAGTEIGYATIVGGNVSFLENSAVGTSSEILNGVILKKSKVGDDAVIGVNSTIIGSVIKSGAKIGEGCLIKNSVIGENTIIEAGSTIVTSGIKENVQIAESVNLNNARVFENVKIGRLSKIYGEDVPVVISSGATIGSNVEIASYNIYKEAVIESNKKLIQGDK